MKINLTVKDCLDIVANADNEDLKHSVLEGKAKVYLPIKSWNRIIGKLGWSIFKKKAIFQGGGHLQIKYKKMDWKKDRYLVDKLTKIRNEIHTQLTKKLEK